MRTIWKYPIRTTQFSLPLSQGWKVVLAGVQEGSNHPQVWIEHDPDAAAIVVYFQVFGTGHPIPEPARWCATWQAPPFVWHLYQVEGQ